MSVVDPPLRHAGQGGPGQGIEFVLEGGGAGSVVGSVLSYDSAPRGRAERGSLGAMLSPDARDGESQTRRETGGGGGAAFDGSTTTSSGSVFGTGDNETSDLLISLADDENILAAAAAAAAGQGQNSTAPTASADEKDAAVPPSRSANDDKNARAAEPSATAENAAAPNNPIPHGVVLPGSSRKGDEKLGGGATTAAQPIPTVSGSLVAGVDVKDADKTEDMGVTDVADMEEFEGEEDGEELERLLKLAETTKVSSLHCPVHSESLKGLWHTYIGGEESCGCIPKLLQRTL